MGQTPRQHAQDGSRRIVVAGWIIAMPSDGGNASQVLRTCKVSVIVKIENALLATPFAVTTSSVVLGTAKSPATVGSGASSYGI
jgi:hypothetical protein